LKIIYGNNKLERQLSNATEIMRAYGKMARKVSARLDEMKSAPNLAVLQQLPQAACHALHGDRSGQWAVSISGTHRMTFEIDQDPVPMTEAGLIDAIRITDIKIVETVNYH